MSYGPDFYVNKINGSYSDVLVAFGLAEILRAILIDAGKDDTVVIKDCGQFFVLKVNQPIQEGCITHCKFFNLIKPIKNNKDAIDASISAWDSIAERERFRQSQVTSQELRIRAKETVMPDEIKASLDALQIHPQFWIMSFISDTKMAALKSYNKIVLQWNKTRKYFDLNLRAILEMFQSYDVSLRDIAQRWWAGVPHKELELDVTSSQLLNPTQGKGQNKTKANSLSMTQENSFWLYEYVKAIGLWSCAAPRLAGNDRKTYVLSPLQLSLQAHEKIFRRFSEILRNDTHLKMDCKAALLYTQALLEYSIGDQDNDIKFEGYGPENVVNGFFVTYYKALKNYVVLNMSFIGLPHWTGVVKTGTRATELKEIIDEHLRIIQSIRTRDDRRNNLELSDVYDLLYQYRDFISGKSWDNFFGFLLKYGEYLLSEWNRKNFLPLQFTTKNLRRLFMPNDKRFSAILESEGFHAIATAIRYSTVTPQYQKAHGDKPLYEIRYGLAHEFKRKARYKDEFIVALANFIQSYNQENAQKSETQQLQYRKNIKVSDIEELIRLVDDYGSEVVCNLLMAFGYARDPKETPEG